ncbi:hypothetical protein A33M_3293 [Rhodovulum sp. PH10]|nr:hypothetical protein A33M_3293 [Rhodovulum sp. PH10]
MAALLNYPLITAEHGHLSTRSRREQDRRRFFGCTRAHRAQGLSRRVATR